jgi:acetolactate synthase small subunit
METIVIHVPEKKSALVKQILRGLGVNIDSNTVSPKKQSAHDFVGIVSKKDAKLMEQAIEEGCEQIHPNDWK